MGYSFCNLRFHGNLKNFETGYEKPFINLNKH